MNDERRQVETAELLVELGEDERMSETVNAIVYELTRHGFEGRQIADMDVRVENARHVTLKMTLRP